MSATASHVDDPQAKLAYRWRLTTERLVAARQRFQMLNESDAMDIRELRRAARMVYDLELERGALGRAMEELDHR